MKDLEIQMSTLIPVIKIEDAKFLIGAEAKMLEIKQSLIIIRIGGGYEPLQDYLIKSGKIQCLKLN